MNFTLRQRIFIGIGIISGVFLAIVLFIMFVRAPGDDIPDTESIVIDSTTGPQVNIINTEEQIPFISQQPVGEVYVKNLARIFTERFSTYSNQNENVHIEDVLPLVTDEMASWVITQGKIQSDNYAGMTTQVLRTNILNFDDVAGTAQVEISARQMVMTADPDGSGRVMQDELIKEGVLDFIQVGDDWKVDGLWWKDT